MTMTPKQLANLLHGRDKGFETNPTLVNWAKQNGLVIVHDFYDNTVIMKGADNCYYEGYENGIIEYNGKEITVRFCEKQYKTGDVFTWSFKTEIPHEKFMIFDFEQPYCEGIVFNINN